MKRKEKAQPLTKREKRNIWFGFFIGFIIGVITLAIIISVYNSIGN
jgi:hypothetical protein